MQVTYTIDATRVMNFIKKAIKPVMTIEECHYTSDLFKSFVPTMILSETNKEKDLIETELSEAILDEYSFLDTDMGFELCNGLFGSLPYNLFQLLAGNFVEGEAWRLEDVSEEVNQSFLKWIKD